MINEGKSSLLDAGNFNQTDTKFKDYFVAKVNFVDKDKYSERVKNVDIINPSVLLTTNKIGNTSCNLKESDKEKEREEVIYNKNDNYTVFFDKINDIRKEYFTRYKSCECKIVEVETINKKIFELLISQIKNFIPLNMEAFDKLLPPTPTKSNPEKKKEQIEAPITKIDGNKILNFNNKEVPKSINFYMNMLDTNYRSNDNNTKKNFNPNPKKFLVIDTTKKNYLSNNEGDSNNRSKSQRK